MAKQRRTESQEDLDMEMDFDAIDEERLLADPDQGASI